jgi:hypothetical protein
MQPSTGSHVWSPGQKFGITWCLQTPEAHRVAVQSTPSSSQSFAVQQSVPQVALWPPAAGQQRFSASQRASTAHWPSTQRFTVQGSSSALAHCASMQQLPQPTFSQQTPPSGHETRSQKPLTQVSVVHGLPSSQDASPLHSSRGMQPASPQYSDAWHSAFGGLVQKPAKHTSSVHVLPSKQSAAAQHSLQTPSQQS